MSTLRGRERAFFPFCATRWGCTARRMHASRASGGSCSVYLDGALVCACLVLAGQVNGRNIVTVEGLQAADRLHPVQEAFVEAGAWQCGFCTPGLIVATHDLLARTPEPLPPRFVRRWPGTSAAATGYAKIIQAVQLAARRVAVHDRSDR